MSAKASKTTEDMRAFAEAWPDGDFVQGVLAQLSWYHQLTLPEKLATAEEGRWYVAKCIGHGWKGSKFKPKHVGKLGFYLTAIDEQVKAADDAPTIELLVCKSKNKIVAEYALQNSQRPIGVAEYQWLEALPKDLEASLPNVEMIEHELAEVEG